ncbi:hypothetical protein GW17_00027494 [Ensete ventricosum]|nr:hypothetical protein GW17_00027494 [Ensete ventricosum]
MRPARKGRLLAVRPPGAAGRDTPARGRPPAASRGCNADRRGWPLVGAAPVASPRAADPCGFAAGGRCPRGLAVGVALQAAMPTGAYHPYGLATVDRAYRRLPPLRAGRSRSPPMHRALVTASRPFAGGLGHSRPPPCRWPGRGRPPLQEPWPEIIYPCIPDPDGEDEGGQASSSLAVSTQWISIAKLL